MKTQVTKTYVTYDELTDDQRPDATTAIRAIRDNDWSDMEGQDLVERREEILEDKGFKDSKIYYSGFYSQGDGASFDCEDIDYEHIMDISEAEHELLEKADVNFYTEINSFGYRYSHEKTRYIDRDFDDSELEYEQHKELEILIEKVNDYLEEVRLELCQSIYKDLKASYENHISDDAIEQYLKEYHEIDDENYYFKPKNPSDYIVE